jgi:hypothetical protein
MKPQNPERPARSPALYRLSYHGPRVCRVIVICGLNVKRSVRGLF